MWSSIFTWVLFLTLTHADSDEYSSKESWSPSDLQCHKKGLTKYRCFSKCHPKKKICTVDTVVERCSCNGMNVHFINSAVFSLKKSKKITQAGFSVFAQFCKPCHKRCRRWSKKGKKSKERVKKGDWKQKAAWCQSQGNLFDLKDVRKKSKESGSYEYDSKVDTKEESEESKTESDSDEESSDYDSDDDDSESESESESESGSESESEDWDDDSDEESKSKDKSTDEDKSEDDSKDKEAKLDKKIDKIIKNVDLSLENKNLYNSSLSPPSNQTSNENNYSDEEETYEEESDEDSDEEQNRKKRNASTATSPGSGSGSTSGSDETDAIVVSIKGSGEGGKSEDESIFFPSDELSRMIRTKKSSIEQYTVAPAHKQQPITVPLLLKERPQSGVSSNISSSNRMSTQNRKRNKKVGELLESTWTTETGFKEPLVSDSGCGSAGNESITCYESCDNLQGTCTMTLKLDRCTCTAKHIEITEIQKFDMKLGKAIFLAAPASSEYGQGYVRTCGSCISYCKLNPNQRRQSQIRASILSCPFIKRNPFFS